MPSGKNGRSTGEGRFQRDGSGHFEPHYDPSIIAENLQCMMRGTGLSLHDIAKAIAANGEYEPKEYRWLKRIATVGVGQTDKRTLARLEKLASYLTIPFWALRTVRINEWADSKELRRYNKSSFLQYGCMLDQLLPDARFEFVKALLETLYSGMDSYFPDTTGLPVLKKKPEQHQRYILMLFRLLETGKYEYLGQLITELYGRLTRESAAGYERELSKGSDE